MRRLATIGLCALAGLASTAVAATTASAAAPEFGRCIKKATKGGTGYSNAGCTTAATNATYEWAPGPGANPKFKTTTRKVGTAPRKDCETALKDTKIAKEYREEEEEALKNGEPIRAKEAREEAEKYEKKEETYLKDAKLTQKGCEELVNSENGYEPAAELHTKSGEVVTCKQLLGEGEYTSANISTKEIEGLTVTFSGCESKGVACHSGAAEGKIVTPTLKGELGVVSTETKENETIIKTAGIALSPATGSEMAKFNCGGTEVTVTGSVIRAVDTDTMRLEEDEEFKQAKGEQEPEAFVGEPKDVLESTFGSALPSQSGLTTRGEVKNEEEIEVNRIV